MIDPNELTPSGLYADSPLVEEIRTWCEKLHTGDCPMTNSDAESRTICTCEADVMNGAIRMFPEGSL